MNNRVLIVPFATIIACLFLLAFLVEDRRGEIQELQAAVLELQLIEIERALKNPCISDSVKAEAQRLLEHNNAELEKLGIDPVRFSLPEED